MAGTLSQKLDCSLLVPNETHSVDSRIEAGLRRLLPSGSISQTSQDTQSDAASTQVKVRRFHVSGVHQLSEEMSPIVSALAWMLGGGGPWSREA
jgi:hypothetical protein